MMESMLAGVRDMAENASFMSEVPLVRDLRTTWEGGDLGGTLGQRPVGADRRRNPRGRVEYGDGWIDVLSPGGEYVGTFSLEEMSMPGAFGPGGLVAFVETDEFEVATIIVKRLPEAVR